MGKMTNAERAERNEKLFREGNFDALFEENEGIVHHMIKKNLGKGLDFEDLYDVCVLSFCRVIKAWDPDNKSSFVTYYCKSMEYAIMSKVRNERNKVNKAPMFVSLDLEICENNASGQGGTLKDIITNDLSTPESILCDTEMDHDLQNIIESLKPREQQILESYLRNKTQQVTADELGISQSYVSKVLKRIGNKIKSKSYYKVRADMR